MPKRSAYMFVQKWSLLQVKICIASSSTFSSFVFYYMNFKHFFCKHIDIDIC